MRAERFSSLMFKCADERQGFFHSSCSVHVVCVCVCVCAFKYNNPHYSEETGK